MNCIHFVLILVCTVFARECDSIIQENPDPTTSCQATDDCEDEYFCHNKLCYPSRQYKETCRIDEQCPLSVICRKGVCLCEEGYEHNDGKCSETEEHKKWREDQEKKRKDHKKNQLLIWEIIGIVGVVIAIVALVIIRYRMRKNKVRMNIQERRKSVLDQSRDPVVSLPMSSMNSKRKFSQHYTERF